MFARDPNLPRPPTPASRSQATSDVLREPDWASTSTCATWSTPTFTATARTPSRPRLKPRRRPSRRRSTGPHKLEMCMKNCGVMFHAKVIEKACLDETSKAAPPGGDSVKQKALALVQEWAAAPTAAVQSRARRTAPQGRALPAHGAHVRRGHPDVHPAPQPRGHRRAEARADGPGRRRGRARRGGGGGGESKR